MKKLLCKIDVAGVTYKLFTDNASHDQKLTKMDAYEDSYNKQIIVDETLTSKYRDHVIKHEVTHAFLYECGLDSESWARNEEIVDWISIKAEELASTFKKTIKVVKGGKNND